MRCRVKVYDTQEDEHRIEYVTAGSAGEAFIQAQDTWPAPRYKIEYVASERETE